MSIAFSSAGHVLLVAGMIHPTQAPEPSAGEPRIESGSPAVSGSFLRPYTNRWRFCIRKPGAEPVEAGVWSDRLEAVTYRGRAAMKRTQIADYKKGIRLTFVNVFDPKTMASLSFDYSREDTGETRHLEFDDARTVRFRRTPGSGSEAAQDYTARFDHGILDYYDGLYGILLDAFPLAQGYAAVFPAFDSDRAAIDWIKLRVTGRERMPAGQGRRADAWVVRVESSLYASATWWVTREPPYVLKAVLVLPEKEGGAEITYTMI